MATVESDHGGVKTASWHRVEKVTMTHPTWAARSIPTSPSSQSQKCGSYLGTSILGWRLSRKA